MVKVSVIVPVYNVEKYLDKCLNSLVNQTLKDIEIIVVNDGSPDNSHEIIDKYANEYKCIKSYKKKNGGLSDARNYGLDRVNGEYIAFIDSDDYVDSTMLEKMYNKAISNDFDMVVCDLDLVDEEYKFINSVTSKIDNDLYGDEIKRAMINFYPVACNKLYKKELFDNDIKFKKNILFEDVEFNHRIIPYVKSIGTIKENLYHYVQRDGSITRTYGKRLYDHIKNWNGIVEFYKKRNMYDKYHNELEFCYVRYMYATFVKCATSFEVKDEYYEAVDVAIENVKTNFPNYRKNKYFYNSFKGIYLLLFNKQIAKLLYILKKNSGC